MSKEAPARLVRSRANVLPMKLKMPRLVLLLLGLATSLPAADLYEAVLGPGYVPEIKSKKVPTVAIKRLSALEQTKSAGWREASRPLYRKRKPRKSQRSPIPLR